MQITLRGWRPGLNKVTLSQKIRDGGIPLDEALRVTELVLARNPVRVNLPKYNNRGAVLRSLRALGAQAD